MPFASNIKGIPCPSKKENTLRGSKKKDKFVVSSVTMLVSAGVNTTGNTDIYYYNYIFLL
jgi:hypothetical protein